MDEDKVRLNLEIATSVKERAVRLQKLTGVGTITEVIRRALVVYEVLTVATEAGEKVLIRAADGGERQLIIL